ncbi:MAG: DHH family phosphoesterase, partial [Gammaproteobacteria bacterium]|nr:DHH family phosphoesterase [Gammaproteobacteria bacterium]
MEVLRSRGVTSAEDLDYQLNHLPRPEQLANIHVAADILAAAITQNKHILIVGDFDCDGATGVSVGMLGLSLFGAKRVSYLVPNRFDFGYGLTPELVEHAEALKPDVIVTVDNGISSVTGVAAAKARGWQVIVTDHHLPGDQLPDADAIVNPNLANCTFPSKA